MSQRPVGRDAELDEIGSFLRGIDGGPAVLVLEGPAGIGKTTLMRAALEAAAASGTNVLQTSPVESEAGYAFCHLADVLDAVADDVIDELAPPQRRALEFALLRSEPTGPPPNQRAVAAAALSSMRALGAAGPLVVAVDDVQWADAASVAALAYVVRRLGTEPVRFVVGMRTPSDEGPLDRLGTHRVEVAPLDAAALGAVLRSRLGRAPRRSRMAELHAASGGNPFYALEFARALEAAGPDDPSRPLPVPENLRDLVAGRISSLPQQAQRMLLVLALVAEPAERLTAKAAAELGIDPNAIGTALDAQIVLRRGPRLEFAHPLYRSVLVADASADDTARTHAVLAGVVRTAEERAWHIALSTDEPDAVTAEILEEAAERARARGAPEAAARLGRLGVDLTPDFLPEAAHTRRLATADHLFAAGDVAAAREMLEAAAESAPEGPARAEALVELGLLAHRSETFAGAAARYEEGLAQPGLSPGLEGDLERELAYALLFQGRPVEAATHVEAAVSLAALDGSPERVLAARIVEGVGRFLTGGGYDPREREDVLASPHAAALPVIRQPRFILGLADTWLGDLDAARDTFQVLVGEAGERGDEGSLPLLLNVLAEAEFAAGATTEAEAHLRQALELADEMGQMVRRAVALAQLGRILSQRGDLEQADACAAESVLLGGQLGSIPALMFGIALHGWVALSRDDPSGAVGHYEPLARMLLARGIVEPSVLRWMTDAVEAFVLAGNPDLATEILAPFHERAVELGRDAVVAKTTRARGVIVAAGGDRDGAVECFDAALKLHERASDPFERARTLLTYGTVLRRSRSKRAARERLAEAREVFGSVGASLWVERCDRELAGIAPAAAAQDEPTPTERRVAELIVSGMTNKEVAATLMMSPKTVEAHLSRLYRKFGVRSRTELAARFAEPATPVHE